MQHRTTTKAPITSKKPVVPPTKTGFSKDWKILQNKTAVLPGLTSQAHKKYKGHTDQGAAVCIVANVFASLKAANTWSKETLNEIIELGTNLYQKSLQTSELRCLGRLDPPKIFKYFYINDKKVSTHVRIPPTILRLSKDRAIFTKFEQELNTFLKNNNYGILSLLKTYFAIWKLNNQYYMFDPLDHDREGGKWKGIPGQGHCIVIRSPNIKTFADTILKTLELKPINKFIIYPFEVDNVVGVNTIPPESIPETQARSKFTTTLHNKPKKSITSSKTIIPQPASLQLLPKIPPTKPKLTNPSNFIEVVSSQIGILRASTHQKDPNFTKQKGSQSLSNAIAALIMLRVHKSKNWTQKTLDDVLKLGELIYHNSKKLKPGEISDKIAYKDKKYSPKIHKISAIGHLKSDDNKILNLEEAVKNILIDTDCCVLIGPNLVAIWKDDNRYYMFDPNERNSSGKIPMGESGVACLTWFNSSNDLTNMYMANISKNLIKSRFMLCKVTIEDYEAIAENWYNFQALNCKKWILRGNFSQQDRRFPAESRNAQCTANATLALAYKELKEEKDWDNTTVDQVLLNGDEFYRNCVQSLQDAGKFKDKYLMVDELNRSFNLEEKKVDLEIDDCLVNGVINAKSDTGILNLKKGFENFFQENEAGIVTANFQSMAIWKKDNIYYYYDSHSRNEVGVVCGHGTACILRLVDIEDLTNVLTRNLGPDKQNFYNISRIVVKLLDISENGVVIPPLNNYQGITDFIAILRGNISQEDKQFGINSDKQTIPNCLTALGLHIFIPSNEWNSEDIDQILSFGNVLYSESMEINYKKEDTTEDAISTNNVKNEFKIGTNLIKIEFEDLAQGNIQENLKEALELQVDTSILESKFMTVSLWFENNLFYLFDPKARNEKGEVYGKNNWNIESEIDLDEAQLEIEDQDIDEIAGGDNLDNFSDEQLQTNIQYNEEITSEQQQQQQQQQETSSEKDIDFQNGKACVLRFCKKDDLIQHIFENIPSNNQREELDFTLKKIKITNIPILHQIHDPKEEKLEEFVGDWNAFKEINFGKWILRGSKTMDDDLFPKNNRNRQEIPMCIVALVFINLYDLNYFEQQTLDDILLYGDRLFSLIIKSRKHDLEKIKELSEEEIDNILLTSAFSIDQYPKTIALDGKKANWMFKKEAIVGDLTSNIDSIFNLNTALQKFFEENNQGIIECRLYFVAIWKLDDMFYMFDPHPAGPSGFKSPIGAACITRFKDINNISKLYSSNLPKIGNNFFEIHSFNVKQDVYTRKNIPPIKSPKIPKMGGFVEIMLGKYIIQGGLKLDSSKFENGVHLHSPAIAFIALALSISRNPDTWTTIMIDEILKAGEELYNDTLDQLGDKFNPWENKLTIYQINPDFKLGTLKVNASLRFIEQRGLVDIKNSKIPNLRQGLEKFFEENSHGILIIDKLILPIWEQKFEEFIYYYIYDPNSRGATGLPSQGGVACAVKFTNLKAVFDHILACMFNEEKALVEYSIIPVEIVIGSLTTRKKAKFPKKTDRSVAPKSLPIMCPDKSAILEQKRLIRKAAEEDRQKKELLRLSHLGKTKFFEINNNKAILRGVRRISKDRGLAISVVAYIMLKTASDVSMWNQKQVDLILQAGDQLFIDSFNAYQPPNTQITLDNLLRRVIIKDKELKIEIKTPLNRGRFTQKRLLEDVINIFNLASSCILNYQGYFITLYFKSGYYYQFDPYGLDLSGNRNDDGVAALMRFSDLETMVEDLFRNLSQSLENESDYVLIFLGIQSVQSLRKNVQHLKS